MLYAFYTFPSGQAACRSARAFRGRATGPGPVAPGGRANGPFFGAGIPEAGPVALL